MRFNLRTITWCLFPLASSLCVALGLLGIWLYGGLRQGGFPLPVNNAQPVQVYSMWPVVFITAGGLLAIIAVLTSPLDSLRSRHSKILTLVILAVILVIACLVFDRGVDSEPVIFKN